MLKFNVSQKQRFPHREKLNDENGICIPKNEFPFLKTVNPLVGEQIRSQKGKKRHFDTYLSLNEEI